MKHLLSLLLLFCIGQCLLGQADPEWLKSWNEAVAAQPKKISTSSRIATMDELGTPMTISGTIYHQDGTVASGVIVHAYHRDSDGYDFGKGDDVFTTWRLQGWAKTDMNGSFKFETIRPGTDHMGREGAHIHFTLVSKEHGKQWAPTVFLADDPLVTESQRLRSSKLGKFGWVVDIDNHGEEQLLKVNFKLKETPDF